MPFGSTSGKNRKKAITQGSKVGTLQDFYKKPTFSGMPELSDTERGFLGLPDISIDDPFDTGISTGDVLPNISTGDYFGGFEKPGFLDDISDFFQGNIFDPINEAVQENIFDPINTVLDVNIFDPINEAYDTNIGDPISELITGPFDVAQDIAPIITDPLQPGPTGPTPIEDADPIADIPLDLIDDTPPYIPGAPPPGPLGAPGAALSAMPAAGGIMPPAGKGPGVGAPGQDINALLKYYNLSGHLGVVGPSKYNALLN